MYYELRIYDIAPGKMKPAIDRIANHAVQYWKEYGIKSILFGEPVIGKSNQLVYVLEWETLAERDEKWDPFVTDPGWVAVKNETEKDGPIVIKATNMILREIPSIATLLHEV